MRKPRQMGLFDELIVDNFAGGGGASTGIEMAFGRPVDIAINHDPEAITMHRANHPFTKHYCENVWDVDPLEVTGGRPVGLAWFSPDCKHFSKAKGGKPREKKIRGLAWVALRWAALVKPRVIMLENVEEFITWGPLLPDGQPCPKRKGKTFTAFVNALKKHGYHVEWRELRACDYGAPTTRKRLFLIARCDSQPIVWPEPTHGAPKSAGVKAGKLQPWRTAAECIDWSLPCPSIFERDKPLAEATLRRIVIGIKKYVLDAKEPFIVTCNHSGDGFRGNGLGEPFKTITAARDAHGLVVPTLIQTGYGERVGQDPRVPGLEKPLGTVMAQGIKHAVVVATLMERFLEGRHAADGSNEAADSARNLRSKTKRRNLEADGAVEISASESDCSQTSGMQRQARISHGKAELGGKGLSCQSASSYLGNVDWTDTAEHRHKSQGWEQGEQCDSKPRTSDTVAESSACICNRIESSQEKSAPKNFGRESVEDQIPEATRTIESKNSRTDKCQSQHCVSNIEQIIAANLVRQFGTSNGADIVDPVGTIMPDGGGGKTQLVQSFLVKYYGCGDGQTLQDPAHTITSRDRLGLVTINSIDYIIADIGMRMLQPHELYRAQGFTADYITTPMFNHKPLTKTAQVRMCGNSVSPKVAEALVRANVLPRSAKKVG